MPKSKRKGRPSSSASRPPPPDDPTPTHPNPNPNMIQEEEDNDVQQIENPQNPIPILDSQDEIPKTEHKDVKDETFNKVEEEEEEEEEDKDASFNADLVHPEGLRNVTTRRPKKKRKKSKKDTISIEEEEDVKDSVEEITQPDLVKGQIPTSPNDGIHEKSEVLEAESEEHEEEEEEEEEDEDDEEEGMTMNDSYSPIQLPPVEGGVVFNCVFDDNDNNNSPTASNVSKQVPKKITKAMRKNAKKKAKKLEFCKKKLELLKKNLQVIPFSPERKLDFSKHEELFKRLGLWDFLHIEFDMDLRSDLIASFVANYDPSMRASDVNGCRIKVSRADLARALKLPGKKEKGAVSETTEFGSEGFSKDAISFVEDFASSWVLLHEDAWMLPKEVVNMTALIKSGQLHKVDWPSLIWFMVEKELKAAPEEGTLYYASHMQCLMKSQREDLFKEEATQDDPMDGGEVGVDLTMGSSDDNLRQKIEKEQFELCLGPSKEENMQPHRDTDVMDYQNSTQESGGQAEWHMDDKSDTKDLSLRRCDLSDAPNLESEYVMTEEAEDDDGCDLQSGEANVEGLVSADFLQGIGATDVTYSQAYRFQGHSSGDIFHSGIDMHLNTGGTSMFPNTCKRENSHGDFVDDHIMNGHHKRMRNDGSASDFSSLMEQINCLTDKARMMYEEKAQASFNTHNEHQFLELQQQNHFLVDNLQKTQWESLKKDKEIYKLEHELHLMTGLLEGYRTALKQNRRAFSEYRELCPMHEEPLYKDVGPGGLVLSTIETERLIRMVETLEAEWRKKFEACANDVSLMNERLVGMEENVKHLKGRYANTKTEEV